MGRKKVNPNGDDVKDLYPLLDKDEKEGIEGSSEEELNRRIAEIAKNDAALHDAEKQDQHLLELKDGVKEARRAYTDGYKANKQRIAKCREILAARGKDAGDSGLDERTGGIQQSVNNFVESGKKLVGPEGSIKVTVGGQTHTIVGG